MYVCVFMCLFHSCLPFLLQLVRALTVAQCAAPQVGPVALTGFTGFFLFCTGVGGVWAAWKGTRGAIFSSGITLSFTIALLVVNICFFGAEYGRLVVNLVNCRGIVF
jgi:hypothetical protein